MYFSYEVFNNGNNIIGHFSFKLNDGRCPRLLEGRIRIYNNSKTAGRPEWRYL